MIETAIRELEEALSRSGTGSGEDSNDPDDSSSVRYTTLQSLIQLLEGYDSSQYTASSWKNLQTALESAKEVLESAKDSAGIKQLVKKSLRTFSPSCFQNCKIEFCSIILQFCRCGGLFNAKGNPDGFLSHFPSLRDLRLGRFFGSLKRTGQSDLSAFSYAVPAFAALRPE